MLLSIYTPSPATLRLLLTCDSNKLTANNQNKQVYVNMNGPTIAKISSPDYIQPWSTMKDSSSDDEDSSDDSESSDDEDSE
eukprot:COSAG02_NODE_97_length_37159_cov_37.660335_27_plen_81_part_00